MKLGTRVRSVGRILLLAGALSATFLLSFWISMRVAVRAGRVQVPDLTRRTVSDATRMAADLELRLRVDEKSRPSDTVLAGNIAQQDPAAGVDVRPQRTIRVWVSSGPRMTFVPSLLGQTERTVRLRIDQDGLAATLSEFRSPDYQTDVVVAQDPPPSGRATKVSLLVNRGDAPAFVMPDLTGLEGHGAEAGLRSQGFQVSTMAAAAAPGAPPGLVVGQQPPGGQRLALTDPVVLEVSR
jgi:serine/threonine-protein kinase